ncbi:hypothetical protein CXG81DRAFT_26339 [Caulochytrium protostelioides]|uniref:RNI-like protein n=1 Tax=Caulochytrium protostelioides TaxID=1555241 RepID=A0A4P9X712_9FUNG|nr:hypothetical protein CXG81DRAFT_26339 [Caulochytrium protostelioides]|eukprot:RKP00982.1 hypothetical protein CXG81DRAFT_26339 [Caulochytrium protostelioides]
MAVPAKSGKPSGKKGKASKKEKNGVNAAQVLQERQAAVRQLKVDYIESCAELHTEPHKGVLQTIEQAMAALQSEGKDELNRFIVSDGAWSGPAAYAFFNVVASFPGIKILCFWQFQLTPQAFTALAAAVPKMRELTTLQLTGCQIGPSYEPMLLGMLEQCGPSLQKLVLDFNPLGPMLGPVMQRFRHVTSFSARFCEAQGDACAAGLVAALNRGLVELDLTGNPLGSTLLPYLAEQLTTNQMLRRLTIGSAEMRSGLAITHFARAVMWENKTLEFLDFRGNHGAPDAFQVLSDGVKARQERVRAKEAVPIVVKITERVPTAVFTTIYATETGMAKKKAKKAKA